MKSIGYDQREEAFSRDFHQWLRHSADDNSDQLQRVRRNLRTAREQELTPRQQALLSLYYDQGLTIAQIARQEGIDKSSVSRTLRRGRARLQRCLQYSL